MVERNAGDTGRRKLSRKWSKIYAKDGQKLCRRWLKLCRRCSTVLQNMAKSYAEDDRKLCRTWLKVMQDLVKSYGEDSRKLCRRFSKVMKEGDGKVYAGDGYKLAPSRLADFFFLLFISRTLSLSGHSAYLTYLGYLC